jgi:1-phosphofructokinase/tagatose 6-phosphate kinase
MSEETGMITTVTLNAAMDRALVVPNFRSGHRHRASIGLTLPGGRGVTVARALKSLGSPVLATGLAGGLTGENIIQRLTAEGILNDFVRIEQPSRTSTAVIDPVGTTHTEINEHGPRVSAEEINLLIEKLRYLVRASRCLVLAGSLPRDVPDDCYQRILRNVGRPELMTVVTGPDDADVLRACLSADPSAVIVAQREAEAFAGFELSTDEDYVVALDDMGRIGGKIVVIITGTTAYVRARLGRSIEYHYGTIAEEQQAVSKLGSTDTFVAAAVNATLADKPIAERLRIGLAAALANRQVLGAGIFEPADLSRMAKNVEIKRLEPALTTDD